MTNFERPWEDKADFAETAKGLGTWKAISQAYVKRGYKVSRDTIRRWGEGTHGIYPDRVKDSETRTLRNEVKNLNKRLGAQERAHERELQALRAQPREADPLEILAARKQIDRLADQLKQERQLSKTAVRHALLIDEVRELLAPVVAAYDLPPIEPPPLLGDPSGKPMTQVGVLCDQHWGKYVEPISVHGLNHYTPNIAARRYERFVDAFRKLRRLHAHEHPIDECVIILNGDPVNNDHQLHPGDAADVCRVSKQVLDCALVTAQAIWELAHDYPRVRVICPGGDNHGRGGKKPPAGTASVQESWTALYNEQVASLLMNVEHIEFEHTPSYQALFDIKGRSFAAAHGHHLRGGGGALGIPAYNTKKHHDATVSKTVMLLKQTDWSVIKEPEDYVKAIASIVDHTIISHFHSSQKLDFGNGDVRIAPSMVGTDTYVLNALGKVATAAQLSFFVHPRNGIMSENVINLQDVMEEGPSRYSWGALEDGTSAASIMRDWLKATDVA